MFMSQGAVRCRLRFILRIWDDFGGELAAFIAAEVRQGVKIHSGIPYAENKAHRSPDRSLGHKHEVNRDAAQRMQASRENAVSMIGDHAIHM